MESSVHHEEGGEWFRYGRGEARAHVCYGVVQCLPMKSPTIYRRNVRREKNDRLVSVHTSIDCGEVW